MDTQQLQQLIDAGSAFGKPVLIPEGRHVISSPIKLPSNVLIEGENRRAIIEVEAGKRINLFESNDIKIENVWIRNLTFSGSPNYPSPTTSENARIQQLGIDKNIAIFLFPSTTGSTTGRISGIRISECHFDELKGCSISIGHDETITEDIHITSNTFSRGAFHGKVVVIAGDQQKKNTSPPSWRVKSTITYNWISRNGNDNWRHPRLKSGTSSLSAIHVDGIKNVDITDNFIDRTAEIGVRVEESVDVHVTRNRILNAGASGIAVYRNCLNVSVIDNTIHGWGRQPTITAILAPDTTGGDYLIARRGLQPGATPDTTWFPPGNDWQQKTYRGFDRWPYTMDGIDLSETKKMTDDFDWLYNEGTYSYHSTRIVAPRFDRGMAAVEIHDKVVDVLVKGNSIVGSIETSPVDGRYIYACDFGISLVPGVNQGLDRTSTLIHVKSNDIRNVVGYAVFHLRHLDEDDRTNPSNLATQCFYKNNYVNGIRIADAERVDEFLIDRSGARG